jgi:hypothetical protein
VTLHHMSGAAIKLPLFYSKPPLTEIHKSRA